MSSRVRRRRLRASDMGDERSDVVTVRGDRPRWDRSGWPPLPPWGYYGPPPWVRAGIERLAEFEDEEGAGRGLASEGVDVHETDDAWIVEADLPGVERANIAVEVRGTVLHISGATDGEERTDARRRRSGRRDRFDYRVEFPDEPDEDGITADLASGVLTVSVPKQRARAGRRIEVRE